MQDADLEAKFAFIEDADLWRWALPDSRAFHIGLGALHLDYDANANPFIFDTLLELSSADIIAHVRQPLFSLLPERYFVNLHTVVQ